jgi:hypothetical protein
MLVGIPQAGVMGSGIQMSPLQNVAMMGEEKGVA